MKRPPICSLRFCAALALTLATSLGAQESWTTVSSPTAQNLWGIAARPASSATPALFVAVGEAGTILTSPDALTWTPRTAPTPRWLTSVTYAADRFVATGDAGTLLTSPDGLTWTLRPTGTTQRLNAVAYGNTRWLAVGENSTGVTSADGVVWAPLISSAPPADTPAAPWLRGLCFAYGSFVTVGERGAISTTADTVTFFPRSLSTSAYFEGLSYARHRFVATGSGGLVLTSPDAVTWRANSTPAPATLRAITFFNNLFVGAAADGTILTSPDASVWTSRPTANTTALLALASTGDTIVAVGTRGTVLRSTATQSAPALVTPPASLTEAAGNHVLLTITATGTAPLSYQWSFAGQPLPGATADTLTLPSVTASNSGSYTVTVTNSLGSVTSPAATLAVIPFFPSPTALFDPAFSTPTLPDSPTALVVQPDGKIFVGGTGFLTRFNADGTRDQTFRGEFPLPRYLTALALQPDGKILVADTAPHSSVDRSRLYRLNADGTPDPSFFFSASTNASQLLLQPDGKLLVVDGSDRIYRLHGNGSADTTFSPPTLTLASPETGSPRPLYWMRAALTTEGKILLLGRDYPEGVYVIGGPRGYLARFNPDGTLDPGFPAPRPIEQGARGIEPRVFHVQADGRIVLAAMGAGGVYSPYGGGIILRLNVDGSSDHSFTKTEIGSGKYGGSMTAARDSSGSLMVIATEHVPLSWTVTRYTPDGANTQTIAAPADSEPFTALGPIAVLPDGRVLFTGRSYTSTNPTWSLQRLVARNVPLPVNPPVILSPPAAPLTVPGGAPVTLRPSVAGTAPFATRWFGEGTTYATSSETTLHLPAVRNTGTYYATFANAAGTRATPAQLVIAAPQAPQITAAPGSLLADPGRTVTFTVASLGSGTLTYEWFHNGVSLSRNPPPAVISSGDTLTLYAPTPADAGDYRVVITNSLGSVTSPSFTLAINLSSRLANVSTRASVGPGERALIAGFSIVGPTPKYVRLRAVGPSLASFGIAGFLPDPLLTLYNSAGRKVAENDSWFLDPGSSPGFNAVGMFPLVNDSRDARLTLQLPPGNYTAQITAADGGTGLALVEVYEDEYDAGRLANVSTRAFVGSGAELAIPGIVIRGTLPKTILVRAVGPTLAQFGVAAPLANPTLTLTDTAGTALATNDDWENLAPSTLAALRTSTAAVGAFALPTGSRDAALLVTIPPGSYTALVTGVNNTTGVALVEVYEVP